jgi:hypothetical protein
MAYKIVSGPIMNLFGRGEGYGASATGEACSATIDSDFPIANGYDGRPSKPVMLTAPSNGFYFTFPNNLVQNGDMEQGAAVGWTSSGSPAVTSDTTASNVSKGSKSLKIVTATNGPYTGVYQDVTVQAGEYVQLWASAKSDGTHQSYLLLQCRDTNKQLKGDGTWGTAQETVMYTTSASMTAMTPVSFRVPTYTELGKTTATLRVYLLCEATSQTSYFDEVLLVPGINFVGLFGHNLDQSTGSILYTSGTSYWHSPSYSAAFGTNTNAIGTRQASYYSNSTMIYSPFILVDFQPGAAWATYYTTKTPYIGELVVGQLQDLDPCPDYPVGIEYIYPQTRVETARGDQWVMNRTRYPRRRVTMSFAYFNDTEYQKARDEIYSMSEGGAYPIVLVPADTDSGEALYGRVQQGVTFIRNNYVTRTAEFVVTEEPFPVMA